MMKTKKSRPISKNDCHFQKQKTVMKMCHLGDPKMKKKSATALLRGFLDDEGSQCVESPWLSELMRLVCLRWYVLFPSKMFREAGSMGVPE